MSRIDKGRRLGIRMFQEEGPACAQVQWWDLPDAVALCLVFSFMATLRRLVVIVRACYVPGALHLWLHFILSSEIHLSPYFINEGNKTQRA